MIEAGFIDANGRRVTKGTSIETFISSRSGVITGVCNEVYQDGDVHITYDDGESTTLKFRHICSLPPHMQMSEGYYPPTGLYDKNIRPSPKALVNKGQFYKHLFLAALFIIAALLSGLIILLSISR